MKLVFTATMFVLTRHVADAQSQDRWDSIPLSEMGKCKFIQGLYRPEIKPTDEGYFICSGPPAFDVSPKAPRDGEIIGPVVTWKFVKYNSGTNKLWIAGWINKLECVLPPKDSTSNIIHAVPSYDWCCAKKIFFKGEIYSFRQVYYNGDIQNSCINNNFGGPHAILVWNNVPKPTPPTFTITTKPESDPWKMNPTSFPYFTNKTALGTFDSTDGYFEVQLYPTKDMILAIGELYFDLGRISFKDLIPKGVVLDLDSALYNDSLKGWVLPDTLASMQRYSWIHKFTNTGDDTLKIEVINTHACIANSPPWEPILPGESGEIKYVCECEVSYPHYRGFQATIRYNGRAATIKYFIYFK